MLLCAEADIEPIFDTLDLPPDPCNSVKFYVTPLNKGELNLTIVLLLKNEPIHRTTFSCEAEVAETRAASAADSVVTFTEAEGSGHEIENY